MEYTNPSVREIKQMIAEGKKPIMFYHISKEEVLQKDYRAIARLLKTVTTVGKDAKRSLVLTQNGYDDVSDELYELQEVREFVRGMFDKYPYLLYYIADFNPEIDNWLLCCLADEVVSVFKGERMTGDEIWEKYGLDKFNQIPKVHAHLTFKGNSEDSSRLIKMLKSIIRHGKLNKDSRASKRIALEYAFKFDNTGTTIDALGIPTEEIIDLMKEK